MSESSNFIKTYLTNFLKKFQGGEEDVKQVLTDENLLSEEEVKKIIYKIYQLDPDFPNNVSHNYLKELEFFQSNLGNTKDTFFNKINNTQTQIGRTRLTQILTQPTNNITILQNRKKAILFWISNPKLLQQMRQDIEDISKLEKQYMWLLKPVNPDMKKVLNLVYFDSFWNRWINNKEDLLQYYYFIILILYPLYGIISPILFFMIPYIGIRLLSGKPVPISQFFTIIKNLFIGNTNNILKVLETIFSHNKSSYISKLIYYLIKYGIVKYTYLFMMTFTYIYGIYSATQVSISYNKIINLIHKKLNSISLLVTKIQSINEQIGCYHNRELYQNIGNLKPPKLCERLWTDCFKKEPGWFSNKGRVLSQYHSLRDNTECLIPYLKYLAELDVWTSVASWYLHNNVKFSIPDYIINTNKPELHIENFYNIMIPDEQSVVNDIHIGGQTIISNKPVLDDPKTENQSDTQPEYQPQINDNPNNILITGANASGKSTCLKAIMESVILGQTICVVPSSKISFTPFKLINTYLNIPDCQGKESLFQAEMSRCYQQINKLKELEEYEFSLSIMDEIFVSTNYYEGVSGAYAVSRKMANFPNSLCLISTHFPVLSSFCKKDARFSNYYFPVNKLENGEIEKSYKLTKGENKEHLALKLLQDKGFDDDIIQDAQKMYSYLMKKENSQKPKPKPKPKPTLNKTKSETKEEAKETKETKETKEETK